MRRMLPLSLSIACARSPEPTGADSTTAPSSSETSTGLADDDASSSDDELGETTDATNDGTSEASDDGSSTGAPELPHAIGLVQYDGDIHFGEPEVNLAALTDWAEQAVARGAKIIVLPEGSTYGYASPTEVWCAPGVDEWQGRACRDVSTVAETLPGGTTTQHWAEFAATHDATVIYHVPERDGDAFYASLGVVDPDGYVTRYRKRALYYVDAAYATAGDESVVIDTPYGRFGLLICLDGTYDGPYYDAYLAADVDGIIISMDWDDDPNGQAAAIEWFRERAAVNDVRIYAADVSTWDGTGLYLPGDVPRERDGLPPVAVDVDGISVHALP